LKERCLAIWLDGFRTDYLDEKKTPFIYKLSQKALTGEYQPLLAFVGIGASILTGVRPLKHGIWTEFCHDPVGSPFKWTRKVSKLSRLLDAITDKTGVLGQWTRAGLTLSAFDVSKRMHGATYTPMAVKIPLHSLHFFNTSLSHDLLRENALATLTLFDFLHDNNIPFKVLSESEMRDSQIFKEAMRFDQNARLVFIQLGELDIVGHAKGPNSKEIHQSLRTIDTRVRRIVEEHHKNFETDVIIFSDHGMVEVKKTVNILSQLQRSGLRGGRDFITFLDSTLARFWILRPEAKQQISTELKAINGGSVLSDDDLKHHQIPIDRKYGDIIWLADPGTLILPNYYQGTKPAKGMHGYAPGPKELASPIIIHGEDLPSGRIQRTATPTDILPTILDLMNIDTPAHVEGKSLLN